MNTVKTIISYSTKIISIIIPIVFVVDCLANCKLMCYYPLSMFSYVTYILSLVFRSYALIGFATVYIATFAVF